ncbi:hypothetical protein [Nocardioides pyridinolyticus]
MSDGTDVRSWVFTKTATPADPGATVRVRLDASSKTALALLAYAGAGAPTAVASASETGSGASHLAPATTVAAESSTVVRYWVDKSSTPHGWTLPAGITGRAATTGSGGGLLTAAAGDTGGAGPGTIPALAATAGLPSSKAVAWTLVLPPA